MTATETAAEAMVRHLAPLHREIRTPDPYRYAAACDDEARRVAEDAIARLHILHPYPTPPAPEMVPFTELRPGMAVEHDAEWWVIVTYRAGGRMWLRRESDSHMEWVESAQDEMWHLGSPF